MKTLYEILKNKSSDEGIKGLKIFYDTLVYSLKYKSGTNFFDVVIIQKINFDYEKNIIIKDKNPLIINFGDTENSSPFLTNGNCYIDCFLDRKTFIIRFVGLQQTCNNRSIPIVYEYKINNHKLEKKFPLDSDVSNFNGLPNYSFKSGTTPIAKIFDRSLFIAFQTNDEDFNYINRLEIDVKNEDYELKDYEITKYDSNYYFELDSVNNDTLFFKYDVFGNNYRGVFNKFGPDESVEDPLLLSLDDDETLLALDSPIVLRLDV